MPTKTPTPLAARIVLVLLGAIAGLGVTEVALRALATRGTANDLRGLHEPRPDRPWLYGLRPGVEGQLSVSGSVRYRINTDGFRDRLYQRPKPPGTFRIVVLGDSITFGYGVEVRDTFPKLLEAQLAELAPDQKFEVLSLGVNGYNPYNEAALFADIGVTYEPDLVLVQFCINDLNDPTLHFDAQTRLDVGMLPDGAFPDPAQRPQASPPSPALRLCRRLRICSLVNDAVLAWTATPRDAETTRRALAPNDGRGNGPEWNWLAARYGEIARRAASLGAPVIVLAFPYRDQLDPNPTRRVEDRLVDIGEAGGWTTIDLLPAFRRTDGSEPLFLDVWHPNAAGHRVAAKAILDQLRCRKLLPLPTDAACVP